MLKRKRASSEESADGEEVILRMQECGTKRRSNTDSEPSATSPKKLADIETDAGISSKTDTTSVTFVEVGEEGRLTQPVHYMQGIELKVPLTIVAERSEAKLNKEDTEDEDDEEEEAVEVDDTESEGTLDHERDHEQAYIPDERPYEDRLYKRYGDSSTTPKLYKEEELEAAGGMLVDIETGQMLFDLFDLSCTGRPHLAVRRSKEEVEKLERMIELYKNQMAAAANMWLPTDDDDDDDFDFHFCD